MKGSPLVTGILFSDLSVARVYLATDVLSWRSSSSCSVGCGGGEGGVRRGDPEPKPKGLVPLTVVEWHEERVFGFSQCDAESVGELFLCSQSGCGRGTVGSTNPRGGVVKLRQPMGGDVVEAGRVSPCQWSWSPMPACHFR